jgi:hypothetical protein
MLWHNWVVLIAGSTGSAIGAVRPPNLHVTPVVRRDRSLNSAHIHGTDVPVEEPSTASTAKVAVS